MKNLKEQKGITLVALVVTIIVLLILAGITIALVMQGDSVFSKAQSAKESTNLDSVKSAVSLALLELQTNFHDPATKATVDTAEEAQTVLIGYVQSTGMTLAFSGTTSNNMTDDNVSAGKFYFTEATVTAGGVNYTVTYSASGLTVTAAL